MDIRFSYLCVSYWLSFAAACCGLWDGYSSQAASLSTSGNLVPGILFPRLIVLLREKHERHKSNARRFQEDI
jgi:hypothetical protein